VTQEANDIQLVEKIVVTMDICSSTTIVEDLLKTGRIKKWRNLIIALKEYLVNEAPQKGAELHKFVGDGWILFFDKPYSGKKLLTFLTGAYTTFQHSYNAEVVPSLDTPPEINGLTFGIDEGQLVRLIMQERPEYVGRAINVACRLQGVINEVDIKNGFRILISNRLFNDLRADFTKRYFDETERNLRNINGGKKFKCYRMAISDDSLRIIEARYGSKNNTVDVTFQYIKQMKDDTLDVVVSNDIAQSDPDYGIPKFLTLRFIYKGKLQEMRFKEGSRIQLPL
jgi:class 3 adenylate cyclase